MHILYRLCAGLGTKPRPDWFTKEGCFCNCKSVFRNSRIDSRIELFVDRPQPGVPAKRFLPFLPHLPTHDIAFGSNTLSFMHILDFACMLDDDEIVYFVEDDYLHRHGAEEVLIDGLDHFDYVTLYDHPDKYGYPSDDHGNEKATVCRTRLSHWKRTRSTTMTFAATVRTLREDQHVIKEYCRGSVPQDHRMWLTLGARGRRLASPIPGYSTHCESKFLAPGVDWEMVFNG